MTRSRHRLCSAALSLAIGLALGCQASSERRLFEACESTPECAVSLDCVVLRATASASTAGAGYCTFRCDPRFPCDPALACSPVDAEGIVVGAGDPAARNAFCLRPCEEDRDCPPSLTCEVTASGRLCL